MRAAVWAWLLAGRAAGRVGTASWAQGQHGTPVPWHALPQGPCCAVSAHVTAHPVAPCRRLGVWIQTHQPIYGRFAYLSLRMHMSIIASA